ncbi:MAG: hypothetical protein V7L14_09665 [Nostoc sp.]|uniref:hypothetical protein n=1 Tax=Nostoc sp. TaxID=1180 RepID=UPI002FF6ADDA
MKRTLYIPDELWTQLDQYLKDHPEQNPSSVVQAALAEKLRPKNGSRLLSLAGIVENAPTDASVNEGLLDHYTGQLKHCEECGFNYAITLN